MENKDDKLAMLLTYCSECPDLYNEVSRILNRLFDQPVGAETTLVCTYVAHKLLGGRYQ